MKKRILMIFIICFFLVAVILLLILLLNRSQGVPSQGTPTTVSPTFSPIANLSIVQIVPKDGLLEEYFPSQPIELTFNHPVTTNSLSYIVEPFVKTTIRPKKNDINTFILSPDLVWKSGVTTITITAASSVSNGKTLEKPFIYKLKTAFPPLPDKDNNL